MSPSVGEVIITIGGWLFGCGAAYAVVAKWVSASNDHRKENNSFKRYAKYPMFISERKDNLDKPYIKIQKK